MQKVQEDRWTSNPLTITSSLRVVDVNAKDTSSPPCGFGWCFRFSKSPASGPWGGSSITLAFDPGKLRGSDHGSLPIVVTGTKGRQPWKSHITDWQNNTPLNSQTAFWGTNLFTISLQFPDIVGPIPNPPKSLIPDIPTPIERILKNSLRGEEVLDVKFWLFSGRSSQGGAVRPTPVYASSHLLQNRSEFLDILLRTPGFSESEIVDIDGQNSDHRLRSEEFLYKDDSDLEDEDDGPRDEEENAAENVRFSSTSDIRDSASSGINALEASTIPTPSGDGSQTVAPLGSSRKIVRYGRVISLNDIAHRTFNALLWYLYTGDIAFFHLSSSLIHGEPPADEFACSPKSMYRLADKFQLGELKTLAFAEISSNLEEGNIVYELSSAFTSMYTEIQEMEVDFLVKNFSLTVQKDLSGLTRSVVNNTASKAGHDILTMIILKLYKQLRPGNMVLELPAPGSEDSEPSTSTASERRRRRRNETRGDTESR